MSQEDQQDQNMADAGAAETMVAEHERLGVVTKPGRLSLLPGSNDRGASYQFEEEDHTLGNALRYIIMKNPDVEFCGYSIPHPSEAKMNLRIQTYDGLPVDALRKGLKDLEDLCGVVEDKFTAERDRFDNSAGQA